LILGGGFEQRATQGEITIGRYEFGIEVWNSNTKQALFAGVERLSDHLRNVTVPIMLLPPLLVPVALARLSLQPRRKVLNLLGKNTQEVGAGARENSNQGRQSRELETGIFQGLKGRPPVTTGSRKKKQLN